MKYIWFFGMFFHIWALVAQAPEGRLFLLTRMGPQEGELGYIAYPESQYVRLDSMNGRDILVHEGDLFIAEGDGSIDTSASIFRYAIGDFQLRDSIAGVQASRLAVWQDQLLAACHKAPHFRVFDIEQGMPPAFDLDTSIIRYQPADIAVLDDRAYILVANSVVIVDLVSQDTVATVPISSPLGPGAGWGRFISVAKGKVYVYIDYATAIPRAALVRLDPVNFDTDSLFLAEVQYSVFRPVVADSVLYMFAFDSHYHIHQDTLITRLFSFTPPFALAHDPLNGNVFVHDTAGIAYVKDSVASTAVAIPGNLQAAFFATNAMLERIISFEEAGFSVFPNPASEILWIQAETPQRTMTIDVLDMAGRLVVHQDYHTPLNQWAVPVERLSPGTYFLRIEGEKGEAAKLFTRY